MFKKGESITISEFLDERAIVFLKVATREEAIDSLIDTLESAGKLKDRQTFYQAIAEREKIVSTGIGLGVAIPHAKMEGYKNFFLAIGIKKNDGIEWNSLDGSPIHIVFMIGGPAEQQTAYLNILSKITHAIKDESRRKKILKAITAKDVIAAFEGC